jgi:hypothetical protein
LQAAADAPHIPKSNLAYGFYVIMGGFVVDIHDIDALERYWSGPPQATLTSQGMLVLADGGHFFDISPDAISDKSKATIIGKALICIQVTWMVMQCIARKAASYPLTLLEIHTMVHIVCALLLYTFWFEVSSLFLKTARLGSLTVKSTWQKPLNITEPIIIDKSKCAETIRRIVHSFKKERVHAGTAFEPYLNRKRGEGFEYSVDVSASNLPHLSRFSFFALDKKIPLFLFSLLPAIYGGIHLSVWGFEFPSNIEGLLWKISCFNLAATTVSFTILVLWYSKVFEVEKLRQKFSRLFSLFCLAVLAIAYVLSRLYIVTEALISLRHVPIRVYSTVPWSQNIPHI